MAARTGRFWTVGAFRASAADGDMTATTTSTLLALERVVFLEAITKTPLSRMAADHTAGERMPKE
jgi:hypothetical protein